MITNFLIEYRFVIGLFIVVTLILCFHNKKILSICLASIYVLWVFVYIIYPEEFEVTVKNIEIPQIEEFDYKYLKDSIKNKFFTIREIKYSSFDSAVEDDWYYDADGSEMIQENYVCILSEPIHHSKGLLFIPRLSGDSYYTCVTIIVGQYAFWEDFSGNSLYHLIQKRNAYIESFMDILQDASESPNATPINVFEETPQIQMDGYTYREVISQ